MDGPSGENNSRSLVNVGHYVDTVNVDEEYDVDEVLEQFIDEDLEELLGNAGVQEDKLHAVEDTEEHVGNEGDGQTNMGHGTNVDSDIHDSKYSFMPHICTCV